MSWSARTSSTSTPTTRAGPSSPPPRPRRRRPPARGRSGAPPRPLAAIAAMLDPATSQAWDVDVATGTPTFTSSGNSANNVLNWGGGTPVVPATPSPAREYIYPFTDQWHQARCNPDGVHVGAAQRRRRRDRKPVRDAQPDARLVVPPRASPRRPGTCRRSTSPRTASAATPSRAAPRPGALTGSRNNANQGTPARRPAADHQHVPVAADRRQGLPAVRRRRLRHDGDRPRVHPRDHQPDDRRARTPASARTRAARWASRGATCSLPSTCSSTASAPRARRRSSPAATSPATTSNGIRNYDMSRSPLNYSDVGYDLVGAAVHADGEIWGATNCASATPSSPGTAPAHRPCSSPVRRAR